MIFLKISHLNIIEMVHYMPFDSKHGLGKTEEQLSQEGVLVDSIPQPESIEGKTPVMKWNSVNNCVFYEYIDTPLTPEQEGKKRLEELEKHNKYLADQLLNTQEALTELFEMVAMK